jgi:hypothetical protein
MMSQHIQLSALADHVLNLQALDHASREHMDSCTLCRSDLRWLEQLGALRNFEPPRSAVNAALKVFTARQNVA